jgi:hypothetical protein
MLSANSSPRAEGASPPLKDVPYSKKANTLASLQLHKGSSSYNRNLDVTGGSLQLQDVSRSYNWAQQPIRAVQAGFKREGRLITQAALLSSARTIGMSQK